MLNDNFWKWFGNSKMVNKDGSPKVFYHVTNSDFNEFKPTIWSKKHGFIPDEENGRQQYYFTQHKTWANNFGKQEFSRKQRQNQKTLEVYLKIENPLIVYSTTSHDLDWWKSYFEKHNIHFTDEELNKMSRHGYDAYAGEGTRVKMPHVTWEVIFNDTNLVYKKLKEAGYDGLIIGDTKRDSKYSSSVIVFDSNQIKSVNNNGNWSKSNNIYEQKAYHGTNVEFDKFDPEKIKDYRYGYGIYFTRDERYAGDYGKVKQYEIPDNDYLLSWEDTWQYQSEYVYECLDKLFDDLYDNNRAAWEKIMEIVDRGYGNDGEGLYYNLSEILQLSSKQTSELLYKYGIKGIDSFKGNCQVIFNPEDIKMLSLKESKEVITCYHGSQQADLELTDKPIYLIDHKPSAIQWAKGAAFNFDLQPKDKPTLYTIQVTFNNPKYIYTEEEYYELMDITNWDPESSYYPELREKLKDYDGLIFPAEYNNGATYYMPFNAKEQCKIIKQERLLEESFKSLNEKLEKYI